MILLGGRPIDITASTVPAYEAWSGRAFVLYTGDMMTVVATEIVPPNERLIVLRA